MVRWGSCGYRSHELRGRGWAHAGTPTGHRYYFQSFIHRAYRLAPRRTLACTVCDVQQLLSVCMIQWQSLVKCAATTSASMSRRPTTPTRCQCARGAPSRRSCRFWRYAADSIVHKHTTAARALSLLTTFGVPVRLQVVEWLVEPAIITSGEVKISFECVVSLTLPPNCHPPAHFPCRLHC